ncbi:uncharacterized protein LOC126376660 [Pectinophora gossypiella]|uniref:uncharacterized protein LOC126376660 n=1 Tax=Pectinophora gossypiella TaxID=13191 RepID=UPI00214E0290|nr:uncharacterized protein LOC126376660 [Pectinophora gossypiella]
MSLQSQVPTLEPFDCEENVSMGSRWEKWKRALEIYFLATSTIEPDKKRAMLLHCGGLALQEIYFNIPGAHVSDATDESDGSINVYETAIKKLDEYFAPKQSYLYERHIFRLIKQEPDEKFEKFLIRLRQQSSKCNFANENENLLDQITEKCKSSKLRKNILLFGDEATLENITIEANSLETVERQLNEYDEKQNTTVTSLNKIDQTIGRRRVDKNNERCCRCGSKNHKSDNSSCPAHNVNCNKCGFKGHFEKHCRTRANKRKNTSSIQDNKRQIKKMKTTAPENAESTSIDYIFHIDDDATINCQENHQPSYSMADNLETNYLF